MMAVLEGLDIGNQSSKAIEVLVESEHLVPEGPHVFRNTRTLDHPGVEDRQNGLICRHEFSVEVGEGLWHLGPGACC
mgnify:CR=1 FL=1